ncbi:MAG: peptidase M61, partial [Bacteroidota bacterium]
MRLQSIIVYVLVLASTISYAQNKKDNGYQYTIDLTKVVDDKVQVVLTPPAVTNREITFYLPKIVPGTYAIADYGRYVSDIAAYD